MGTLCSLITKGTTPKDKSGNGEVNFVKVENIDTDNGEVTSMSKISVEEHEGYLKRSRLEENDILFSIAGTLGRVSVVKPSILPANTNQALAIIRTNEGYIPYLTTVLKGPAVEDFIRRNPTIGAQPNLSLEQVNNLDISYPEYDEQVKIGDYFALLDNLITLHQRKCDETKKLKKYMLQKMFPQKNEKKPEIRFAGFTDDWEQRKLGDIITEYKETVDSDCTLPILTSSKTEGVILQEEHFGRKQQHDITGYNILPRNYCTYRNRSDGVDFTFNINKCCDKGIISKFYPVFSGKNSDVFFLSLVLNNSEEVVREIAYTCTGTGQKVLSFLDLQKMKVRVPNFDEQKEIAAYFESLDHIITLHQRKSFSKNRKKIVWEQRKLEEIVERVTRKNQDLVSELPLTISAQYGLIDQNEFFDKRVASKDVSGYYLIYNGEFAYNKSTSTDAPWGAIKRLDKYENGVLSTLYIVFKIRNEEEVNSDFLVTYYDTSNWHKDIQAIAAEGARNHGLLNIAPADFFKTELMMPQDIDEQKKIGDYFKSLNDLITLHRRAYHHKKRRTYK